MRIKQLAEASAVTSDTIRFYESQGLLHPPRRTTTGYRVFDGGDLARLRFIKKAKRLGFSLPEIKDILRLHDLKEKPCTHVRTLLDSKIAHIDALLRDLQDLKAAIFQLRERADSLGNVTAVNGCICGIIEQAPERRGQVPMTWLSKRGRAKT